MFALLLTSALALASSNTRCPVTGRLVTDHGLHHYVTVHGRRYYVFDQEAARRLKACPACYLAADGTPLNATRPSCSPQEGR